MYLMYNYILINPGFGPPLIGEITARPGLSLGLEHFPRHLLRRSRGFDPAVLAKVPQDASLPLSKGQCLLWREKKKSDRQKAKEKERETQRE